MPVAIQTPATMPTDAALEEAKQKMAEALDALMAVVHPVSFGLAKFKGEHAPTYEDVGRVVAFTERIRGNVGEIASWFETLEKAPEELDYVRFLNNTPDYVPEGDDA